MILLFSCTFSYASEPQLDVFNEGNSSTTCSDRFIVELQLILLDTNPNTLTERTKSLLAGVSDSTLAKEAGTSV